MDIRRLIHELPADGWQRIAIRTASITGITCALAIGGTILAHAANGDPLHLYDYLVAISLSIFFGVPIIGGLSMTLEELRIAHRRLQIYAATDPLTGILSRGAFIDQTEMYLHGGTEPESESIGSLLTIDVDDFKEVNDTFGHHFGDQALKTIVDACAAQIRTTDLFGRMGGEEFAVFLVGAEMELATQIAERIREAIATIDFRPHGRPHHLSISVGISTCRRQSNFTDLYRESDRQLYQAKKNGRNRVEFDRAGDKRTHVA